MPSKIPSHKPPGRPEIVAKPGGDKPPRRDDCRPNANARGYGREWQRLRLMVLRREPLCRHCGAPATDVDHIHRRALGGPDNMANLQALCHACHSRKTGRGG